MIKADHNKLAHLVFSLYLKRLLKSSFKEFILINKLPMIDNSKGLIITPNHFSWWDGFFIYWLNKKLFKKNLFILMLEEQLKRYWFFRYLGCLLYTSDAADERSSVDLGGRRIIKKKKKKRHSSQTHNNEEKKQ